MPQDITEESNCTRHLPTAAGQQRQQGSHCIRPLVVAHDFNMGFIIGINTRCYGDVIGIIRVFFMSRDG